MEEFFRAAGDLDAETVIWLNRGIGQSELLDDLAYLLVSDYFIPLTMCFCMLALWFRGRGVEIRGRNQRAVLRGSVALGFANLAVTILNHHYFRERPFAVYELSNLLYQATDSSFPANPTAIAFGAATGVWLGHRKVGLMLFGLGAVWGLVRVYSGLFYPTDILGGAAVGIVAAGLASLLLRLLEPVTARVLRAIRLLHLA